MAFGIKASLLTSRLQLIADAMDVGAGANGTLKFYTGTRPATPLTAVPAGSTLLATNNLSTTAATVTNNVLTFNTIANDVSADATGTVTWCRVLDKDGNAVMDCDCGLSGSGADIIFNTISFVAGGIVTMNSLTITETNT
jgi:hypothetical protein